MPAKIQTVCRGFWEHCRSKAFRMDPNHKIGRPIRLRYILIGLCLALTALHPEFFPGTPTSSQNEKERVRLGNEKALADFSIQLKGKRLGLVINHTSVLPDGTPLLRAFRGRGITVSALFSPEHGFLGTEEGGLSVDDSTFKSTPVFSLYGKTRRPTSDQMEHIDVFVYDIQDVGTRFYTYITTLKYVLEAAAKAQKEVYVLDRPNPTGGHVVEGPLLKARHRSFIGSCPLPIRYGLTAGELALMMKGEGWVPQEVALHVIKMEGWKRDYFWEDTGLSWIPTSPNIPTPETTIAYPGMGLLGGIIINHGLGTLNPFLQFGAPWMDTKRVREGLRDGKKYGIALEEISYTPLSLPGKVLHPPYENRQCEGLRIRILQKKKFLSVRFTLSIIRALKDYHASELSPQITTLNRHFGDDILVQYLNGHVRFEDMMTKIEEDEQAFLARRQKYLLYD
jgi:uncharacterized protein YbbC (DUF1343 family)